MYVGKPCDQIRPAGLHPCRSGPAGLRLKRAPEEESQLTQAVFWEVRTSSTAAELPTTSAVRRPAGRRLIRALEIESRLTQAVS